MIENSGNDVTLVQAILRLSLNLQEMEGIGEQAFVHYPFGNFLSGGIINSARHRGWILDSSS